MENQIPNCDLLLECPDIVYFDIVEGLYNRFMHDTLFSIFGYLDDNSLRNAEVVSKVWKTVMSDMNPNKIWKNLLQLKIKSSNMWMSLCESTVCQFSQLSTDNPQYFPKLFNKIDYTIKTLSQNWHKSDFTRDYLDYGLGLCGWCLQSGDKLIAAYDDFTKTFMIWDRLSLRLIENYKYPSKIGGGGDIINGENLELYEDALVFALVSGKIVIRNTTRKTTEEHKPFGMDDTKDIVYLQAQNGFLCASISLRGFVNGSYNILVWKFNSLASVDWENFKIIPLPPGSFSRILMDNNFFILQKNYPDQVVCEIRTMSNPREKGKEIMFRSILKEAIYYNGCVASLTYNINTSTVNFSFVDIESGLVKLNIDTIVDSFFNSNFVIRWAYFRVNLCSGSGCHLAKTVTLIQSDFLFVCKDVGPERPGKNILVWNLIDAMNPDVDTSVPLYPVFEAFFDDQPIFFHIDHFGIVFLSGNDDDERLYPITVIEFLPLCGFCREVRKTLRLCSRCKSIKYCGINCQKAHWSHHKKICHNSANSSLDINISL